jgi:hypothetical protein
LKGVGYKKYYLGGDIINMPVDEHGKASIALAAKTYINRVVGKFELLFEETFKEYQTPMEEQYHPELDETDFLDKKNCSVYRGLIGSATWIITLGRFEIYYAVNTMARFSAAPRTGHQQAMKRVFGYLKRFDDGQILIDVKPMMAPGSTDELVQHNWKEFYPDAVEDLPINTPEALGNAVHTSLFVDADHAHDQVTRRSVTGILLFVNSTPVKWYSKRQQTVETSSYGSEIVAARIAAEMVMEIRYALRMLGVPFDGPTTMYGDNKAVILNTSVPSSMLKKKHNAVAYHRVREAIAANILVFLHISTKENVADVLTKPLAAVLFHALLVHILFRHRLNNDPVVEYHKDA